MLHWKVKLNNTFAQMFTSVFALYISKHMCLCHIIAEAQETDQDETDSPEQPRINSTALKMQMTLRSMLDLGIYMLINIMHVFVYAP